MAFEFYFPDRNLHTTCTPPESMDIQCWTKFGTTIYIPENNNVPSVHPGRIYLFNALTGGANTGFWDTLRSLGYTMITNIQAITGFVICLCDNGTNQRVYILNSADGSVSSFVDITSIGAEAMGVAASTLIYLLCGNSSGGGLYYIDGSNLIYVGRYSSTRSPFGIQGFWTGGRFYYGQSGFTGFGGNLNIWSVPIACPPQGTSPVIATISTGSTVAAGASINVTWANILEPASDDEILMRAAPPANDLGFHGTVIASHMTTGVSGGTISFTVPGGTSPGNYVFQLTTGVGSIYIATSNVFAVT